MVGWGLFGEDYEGCGIVGELMGIAAFGWFFGARDVVVAQMVGLILVLGDDSMWWLVLLSGYRVAVVVVLIEFMLFIGDG